MTTSHSSSTTPSSTKSPHIAIIGAGPAGLTLALLLSRSPTPIRTTMYERDTSALSRVDQGGTLDLHYNTGLAAIRKCGLMDEFNKHARWDGDEMKMADKNATMLVHKKPSKGTDRGESARPEIDRKDLKNILLGALPEGVISWGRKLKNVREDGILVFEGKGKGKGDSPTESEIETEGPFDLIVGADGGWSKIRNFLTPAVKPRYSGISGYEMDISFPSTTCPHVNALVGKGSIGCNSDGQFMNAQRLGDGGLKVRTWFKCPEDETTTILKEFGKERTRDMVLEGRYKAWAPEIKEFFRQGEVDTLVARPLYELPVGAAWEHKEGFTLIGDAASLATPFSGEGVNKAMTDALELADFITRSQESSSASSEDLSLDAAIQRFEQGMHPRSLKLQTTTMFNKEAWFNTSGPVVAIPMMVRNMTKGSEKAWVRVLGNSPLVGLAAVYLWVVSNVGWMVRVFWRRT